MPQRYKKKSVIFEVFLKNLLKIYHIYIKEDKYRVNSLLKKTIQLHFKQKLTSFKLFNGTKNRTTKSPAALRFTSQKLFEIGNDVFPTHISLTKSPKSLARPVSTPSLPASKPDQP